jgi:hypothetical protein
MQYHIQLDSLAFKANVIHLLTGYEDNKSAITRISSL